MGCMGVCGMCICGSAVQSAVRRQLEALKRGEYGLAFDDEVLDPFMAGDERQGPGRAESEQACDSGAVGQTVGVRSSKVRGRRLPLW